MKKDEIYGAYKKYRMYEIRAVVIKTKGNTSYGTPTSRRKDNIKMDIREIWREDDKWLKMAQYGNEWQDLPSVFRPVKQLSIFFSRSSFHCGVCWTEDGGISRIVLFFVYFQPLRVCRLWIQLSFTKEGMSGFGVQLQGFPALLWNGENWTVQ